MSVKPELPESWEWTTVGQISLSIQYGHTASAINNSKGPRFLRITDIQDGKVDWEIVPSCDIADDEIEKYKLEKGDLVFARTGATTGKSYLINDCPEAVFASYLIRLRLIKIVNPGYVYAFFQSQQYWNQIEAGKRGIGQPNVNAQVLGSISLPLAPAEEQHRIVAEIEKQFARLDECTSALRRVADDLKLYRASVLKAACEGRLVPTEAELARDEGRDYELAAALLEHILAERRARWGADQLARMKAKGRTPGDDKWKEKYEEPEEPATGHLPKLPEGWIWVTPQQLGEVQLGRQRSPKNRSKNYPTKYIRAANITERGLDLSDVLDMEFDPEERERYRLRYGDIVLSEASGSPKQVGKPAVWRDELPECCFQNTVIRLRPIEVGPEFLLQVFRHYYFNGVFAKVAGGVGINHLSADKFSTLEIAFPPLAEQHRIVTEVERRLRIAGELEELVTINLERADELRRSILKRAFEGHLVPQDPNDELASALLERIAAERQRRAEEVMTQKKSPTDKRRQKTRPDETPLFAESTPDYQTKELLTAFATADERLTVEEVFTRAGYTFRSDDEIDAFLEKLTDELIAARLKLERTDEGEVFLQRSEV